MAGTLQKSPARAAVGVVVVAAAAAAVGAMRTQPPQFMDVCIKHKWFELNAPGKWTLPAAVTTEPQSIDHPVSETLILSAVAGKLALEHSMELEELWYSLPVLSCSSFPSPCSTSLSSHQAQFTRVAQRGVCVVVEGLCKTLVVTVMEPTSCYCGEEGMTGEVRNVSLLDHASGGVCMTLRVDTAGPSSCCCGLKEEKGTRTVGSPIGPVGNTCPTEFAARPGEKNYLEQSKETSGLNEQSEKQFKEEGKSKNLIIPLSLGKRVESAGGGGSVVQLTETQIQDDEDGADTEGDSGGLSELTEQRLKEDSVLEDVVAVLAFLFLGAVLMLIKNRVCKFIRKRRQQDERDVESEETLVDEAEI